MIGGTYRLLGARHRQTTLPQARKSLGARYLVNKMAIDVENLVTALNRIHYVGIPNFIKQCFSHWV
jgi:hypothetical protein